MTGWETVTIGKCCKVIAGQSPESSFYNKEKRGLPFYQGKKDFGDMFISPPTVWTEQVTKTAEADDILMSVRAPVGPVNIASSSICIGRGLAAIRPSNLIHRNYLYYFFKCIEPTLTGTAGAVFPSINKAQIEAIKIPLPPLPVQKAIVAKLDAAFASIEQAIAAAERNAENAKQLFQSYLSDVFDKTGDFKKFDECVEKTKYTNKIQKSQYLTTGLYPIVSQEADEISGYWNNETDVYKVSSPVIVFGDHTRVLKYINFDFVLGADGVKIIKPKPNIDAKWFYYRLMAFPMPTKGYARHFRYFSDLNIHIPPLQIQQSVAEKLDAFDDETKKMITNYEMKNQSLVTLKQSLLQQAFNGQLLDA